MPLIDPEFGKIKIRKSKLARRASLKIGIDGLLSVSAPHAYPDFLVQKLVEDNRQEVRELFKSRNSRIFYRDGQKIGQSHTLIFRKKQNQVTPKIEISGGQIVVFAQDLDTHQAQSEIRAVAIKILRKEAKNYLAKRIEILGKTHGFNFEKLKFTHASTRWGSCSSRGTISLNIALMNLPLELIDYVIIHELCHLRQMNHSPAFWAEVAKYCPNYKIYVENIKQFSPEV